jgi:hypothetical protein
VQRRFGIAAGAKTVSVSQIDSELRKVVDFAIGDDGAIIANPLDGLMSSGRIHDRKPAVS